MIMGINKNPNVKTYAYLAYVGAILENKNALRAEIVNPKSRSWNDISDNIDVCWEDEHVNFITKNDLYGTNNIESIVWTDCAECDELTVRLEHFVNLREYAILNLFACSGDPQFALKNYTNVYRYGITRYGLYIYQDDKYKDMEGNKAYKDVLGSVTDWSYIKWFRLKVLKNKVTAYISQDGSQWYEVDGMELCENNRFNKIGLNVYSIGMGTEYYNWLFMNFIQLNFNKKEVARLYLNYYMMPFIGCANEQTIAHQFLETKKDNLNEIYDLFHNLREYIKYYLYRNYYIIVSIDEFYIPGHRYYQKTHFFHPVMIYGCDENKGTFLILDYDIKLITSEISMSFFESNEFVESHYPVMRYRLLSNIYSNCFRFDINAFIQTVQDFLNGSNQNYRFAGILPCSSGSYGINVFKDLIYDEDGRRLLLKDIRISYLLYEHCLIMKQRIDFLQFFGYISDADRIHRLKEMCDGMIDEAKILNNLVLKLKNSETDDLVLLNLQNKIFRRAGILYDTEKQFYELLINTLTDQKKEDA